MLIFRRTHHIHAAYGTVTVYENSWWPVGTQRVHTVYRLATMSYYRE